ncbi:hypothetical protein J7T55_006156 [Diaporthe amygdali]|uniref:uncharacterized protein n=1 Tax=Phomopsis amygdali TaxID=1214568 RepID=UPI0022FEA0C5|nr:uncharacterized protein J7T55_006156 [Diaporthe amygdali]KAJ0124815.1 hypothetical protein J7T55_006156 [Diaporthe amygdali]
MTPSVIRTYRSVEVSPPSRLLLIAISQSSFARAQIVAPIHLLQRRDSPLGGWRGGPTWGMINATSYTPLESLLLFTWIRRTGASAFEAAAFPRFSRDLINHNSIKEDPTYDASRLNPDSLQELFLQLLQDELKNEATLHQQDATSADAPLSPNSKKRKRPGAAPQLTNLHEAREYAHRLPDAESKLWAKYKQRSAQQLWEQQEELAKLEAEIQQIQLQQQQQQQQAVEADNLRNSASATPNAPPTETPSRPPSVAPAGDAPQAARQPNGTAGPPTQPPTPVPSSAPNHVGPQPPPRQISPAQAAGAPKPPQPLVQPPVASQPGQFAQAAVPQASPRPPSATPPVLQPPQGIPTFSPHPGQPPSATPPASDVLQRPDNSQKPRHPSQPPPTQVPVPGSLKWEPPYQPYSIPQHQRPPPNIAQFPPQPGQQRPQQWSQQAPLQYPPQPPLQPAQQGYGQQHAQQQGPSGPRQILVAPQPAGHAPPPLQPAPVRSHSGSPAPLQPQRLPQGPSPLPVHAHLPQSPYQPTQQVFQPPQPHPLPTRIAPSVSATPPPLSPANAQSQQWQRPPATAQTHPPGAPQGQTPVLPQVPPTSQAPQYSSPYPQPARPTVPQHVFPPPVGTPGPSHRRPHPVLPRTPTTVPFAFRSSAGSGTRWTAAQPTPSTPGPGIGDLASPAFEPLSPILHTDSLSAHTSQTSPTKAKADDDGPARKKAPSNSGSAQRGLETRESSRQRRTPSVVPTREMADEMDLDSATKVKREEATPKPLEETGDTTADESVSGRRQITSPRASRVAGKRKRQESLASDHRAASENRSRVPPPPPGIPTHVLWTRGFPRVSVSTLDQISGHKHANMFSHPIRERDAPGYKTIVLSPTDLKSIRAAITAGNKAAATAAAALSGGEPSTSSVWLPISEELVPPRGIINSSQLERELVHMFSNAIMYNLDPHRGPGTAFMKGSGRGGKGANDHGQGGHGAGGADPGFLGYAVDENSVVNDTQAMFAEVDKLLMELRSTEAQPGVALAPLPPGAVPASDRLARWAGFTAASSAETPASVATVGEELGDDGEEHHTDRDAESTSGIVKRRRVGRG